MTDEQVLQAILSLASSEENVRAVLLEGSRANPNATRDKWMDFDIAYVTDSNAPYTDGVWMEREFLPRFGEIAIMQIPDNGDPNLVYTWLMQFASGIRIDLTFDSLEFLSRPGVHLESSTVVLLDKDSRFADVLPPDESDYLPRRPSPQEFAHCCNEFWWVSPYVAKALVRGQAIHAIEMLNAHVRPEYARMLSWLAGARTAFAVNLGKHDWDAGRHVPAEFSLALSRSYPQAGETAIESALVCLMQAFPALASQAAQALGFEYDACEGERAARFIREFFGIGQK